MKKMSSQSILAYSIVIGLCSTYAQAQSLNTLYESARAFDSSYKSAQSQYEASLAKSEQAKSVVYPTVGLSASIDKSDISTHSPDSSSNKDTNKAGINASVPLFRPANWAGYKQGKQLEILAKEQLRQNEQDLIIRVAQAYFDVLSAENNLTVVQAQKSAIKEQLAAAKRNFEVGTVSITDTREAQSRFDLITAQESAIKFDVDAKRVILDQVVGKENTQPWDVKKPFAPPAIDPANPQAWIDLAESHHTGINSAKINWDIAKLELEKARAGRLPTLDGNLGYNLQKNNPSSLTSPSRTNASTIGISFAYPLFAGFALQAKVREAAALELKAGDDYESAKRSVTQGTRIAYYGVQSGLAQVKALEAAELSSQSALDATKLGYQVGVRVNSDVLNAQSQLYQTKRDLAKARYDALLNNLRLRQASGTLNAQDLEKLNPLFVESPVKGAIPLR